MSFYIKRVFSDPYNEFTNDQTKNIYLNSTNDYIKNKFLNTLSNKLYNLKTNHIYFHDNFKTNYINSITMPDLNISISGTNKAHKNNKSINLDLIINAYRNVSLENTKKNINSIIKEDFYNKTNLIYNLFNEISLRSKSYINLDKLKSFKEEFISHLFKNVSSRKQTSNVEFIISSLGIEGFKTFSNQIPSYENNVFIINDSFSSFKDSIINEVIDKSNSMNICYELYKNPIDSSIDHIRIPDLNLCIISNNILFNDKIPGIQINEDKFLKDIIDKNLVHMKKEMVHLIDEMNLICKNLNEQFFILDNISENLIIQTKFDNLIEDTIKNVIL